VERAKICCAINKKIMHPKNISIRDFTYGLPEEKIAKFPLAERDESKLLIYKCKNISENIYNNIAEYISANSLLIFNNTKVVEARILFQKITGSLIEIFCLEPHERYADVTSAMMQQEKVWWKCLVGGVSKWKPGQILQKEIFFADKKLILNATYIEKQTDCFIIELSWLPGDLSFAEVLHHAGLIPLPPYIKREAEEADAERYQTIYALYDGSVAAPTAGLHFSENIFEQLTAKHIRKEFVTLHVGAGTFKPVKSETLESHIMHEEFIEVSETAINNIINNTGNIFAVGTTSLRTIESLYWLGIKTISNPGIAINDMIINQWDAYELQAGTVSAKNALESLLIWMKKNQSKKLVTKTQLLITPGYNFKIINGLITNFHQPQSTLLLLVAALIGDDWKKIYEYALNNDFRFLSYGDGCLLFKKED
jgi:S-adenosylmethionine:tRNA ribosyltransferase-isomerase